MKMCISNFGEILISIFFEKIAFYGSNVEEWIVTNTPLRPFENSSDELGTGNTRHLRKSIVNNSPIPATVHSDHPQIYTRKHRRQKNWSPMSQFAIFFLDWRLKNSTLSVFYFNINLVCTIL